MAGAGSCGTSPSPSWSDLPADILQGILQRLELPQALVFAAVCTWWRSAAAAAGIPPHGTPWLMSWRDLLDESEDQARASSTVTCKFRHLLDTTGDKAYDVTFPRSTFVSCCGASHGWLVLVNSLCNLVLYNPLHPGRGPSLPPVTDFPSVEAVYHGEGRLEGYRYHDSRVLDARRLAGWFYQKAVLSCSPSKAAGGGGCIVAVVHGGGHCLSFARTGESKWQVHSALDASSQDRYADCAYHKGRLYTATLQGRVERWDLDGMDGPTREVIAVEKRRSNSPVLTRHLVPTPWGDLLLASALLEFGCATPARSVRFEHRRVDPARELGSGETARAMLRHAMFVGLNQSACLPAKGFSGLKPGCIYFSVPWLKERENFQLRCTAGEA